MCLIAGAIGVDSHLSPTAGAQTAHPDVDLQAADGLLKKQAGAEENRKHTETTPTAGIAAQGNHVLRFGFLACQLVIACSVPLLPHDQPHSIDAVDAAQPFVARLDTKSIGLFVKHRQQVLLSPRHKCNSKGEA